MGFDSTSRTHVGHRRKLNEDAVLDCLDRGVWVVADGMGGHHAGEVASAMVVEALSALAPAASFESRVGRAVGLLEDVNQALVELAQSRYQEGTIGSTVVGQLVDASHYMCFWAGDSRGYRLRDGAIVQLTRDHSLVQELVDAGMIEQSEAESHPNANVVTRAVGASSRLIVDTVGGDWHPGDVFLLASDGLTRLVTDSELCTELSDKSLETIADRLIELALERGAPDNVSLILVRAH